MEVVVGQMVVQVEMEEGWAVDLTMVLELGTMKELAETRKRRRS